MFYLKKHMKGRKMNNTQWTVAGRSFNNREDFLNAQKDVIQIEAYKKKYNLINRLDLILLQKELNTMKHPFKTLVGEDFIDELNDSLKKLMNNEKNADIYKNMKKQKDKIKKDAFKSVPIDETMEKQILLLLKKKETRRKILLLLCSFIALCSLSYFIFYGQMLKRTIQDVKNFAPERALAPSPSNQFVFQPTLTNDKINKEDLDILDEYKTPYEKNKKLVGWVTIDGTKIDYPVMQTINNEYYLSHNFNQEYDKNGCIFMDYRCDIVNRSTNLIIYGHNMRSGIMFGGLKKYADESYYKEHPIIRFDTIYEHSLYEVIYVFHGKIYTEAEIAFKYYQFIDVGSNQEFNSYMQSMDEISLYDTGVTSTYGDQFITLSTCDGTDATSRFVVVARRIQ